MFDGQFKDTTVVIPARLIKFGLQLLLLILRVILELFGWIAISTLVVGTAVTAVTSAHGNQPLQLDNGILVAGFIIWVAIRGPVERWLLSNIREADRENPFDAGND